MNDNEVWKSYPEIPFVEVSSFGCVRTLDRVVLTKRRTQFVKGRICKQQRTKDGYLHVGFRVNGKMVNRYVHRLVAQTFIPNPNNWPEVNHKDCTPSNNNVSNLEWCTASYNAKYREKYGISNEEALGYPLFAINLKTLEISRFHSQHGASRELGADVGSINAVLTGKYKTAGGYWFTEDGNRATKITKSELHDITTGKTSKCHVLAVNLATLEVSKFPSQHEAGRQLGINHGYISSVLKGRYKQTYGYWFVNADDNAVEATKNKLGDVMADKIEELMNDKETQLA